MPEKQLVVIAGKEKGKVYLLPATGQFTLGRANDTDTKLTDVRVSRKHCHVEVDSERVKVVDAKSATGTFVNGERIAADQVLQSGDVIKIGDTEMRYESDEDIAEQKTLAGGPPPIDQAPTMAGAQMPGGGAGPAVAARAEPMADLIGTSVGQYTVKKFVAEGVSCVVFRAHDTVEERGVALKVFKGGSVRSDSDVQALNRTLQKVMTLRHANLVALYHVGRDRSRTWFAEEFVAGESMAQIIERFGLAGSVDWQRALRWGLHVGKGLEAMHHGGVIHGNITPRCILISSSDTTAKLGGLIQARSIEAGREKPRADEMLTMVAYRPPERVRCKLYGDIRSDIYSFGATLYALLAGRAPFEGANQVDTLDKVLQVDSAPPRLKEIQFAMPDAFEQVILRMLAKKPEDRYGQMSEVLADLEKVRSQPAGGGGSPAPAQAGPTEGTIAIVCGFCRQNLRPRKKFVGMQVKCPSCKRLLRVPEEAGVVHPIAALPTDAAGAGGAPDKLGAARAPAAAVKDADAANSPLSKPIVTIVTVAIIVVGLAIFLAVQMMTTGGPATGPEKKGSSAPGTGAKPTSGN